MVFFLRAADNTTGILVGVFSCVILASDDGVVFSLPLALPMVGSDLLNRFFPRGNCGNYRAGLNAIGSGWGKAAWMASERVFQIVAGDGLRQRVNTYCW